MIHACTRLLARLGRRGVTSAEYAILASGLVAVVGTSAINYGGNLTGAFGGIGTEISRQTNAVQAATGSGGGSGGGSSGGTVSGGGTTSSGGDGTGAGGSAGTGGGTSGDGGDRKSVV